MSWHDEYPHKVYVNCLTANGMVVDWNIGGYRKEKAGEYKNIPKELMGDDSRLYAHSWSVLCENEDEHHEAFEVVGPDLIAMVADKVHPLAMINSPFDIDEDNIFLEDLRGKKVKAGHTVAFKTGGSIFGASLSYLKHGTVIKITPDKQLLIECVERNEDDIKTSYYTREKEFYLLNNIICA